MHHSARVRDISLSVTLALDARAKELVAGGADVVNMAVGEPDFPAPAAAVEAAAERVRSRNVRYTPAAGTTELRRTIAEHLSSTRGTPFAPEEIAVCHSAKHALSAALLALVEPGDEVILPVPAWVSYFELVRLAGGTPVAVPPTAEGAPDLAAMRAAAGERCRGILFNSPSNPSGYVWTRSQTEELCALAAERDLFLMSDEIYRRLVFEGEPAVSPTSLGDDARSRTVVVDGASKAFAMTGYRIGFAAAPPATAKAIVKLNSQMTGAPNTVSQVAYEAVLREEPPEVEAMAREFAARRDLVVGALRRMGLAVPEPRGAFYAFPSVEPFLDERGTGGFCEDLLEQEGLAIVPGTAFGQEGHVRLSYALDREALRDALGRLERFLDGRRTG